MLPSFSPVLSFKCPQTDEYVAYMFFRPKPGEDLLESATSAMRASTHKLLESKPEVFDNLEGSDFDQMVRFGANSPFATVRINMVQIIGGMGVANTSGTLCIIFVWIFRLAVPFCKCAHDSTIYTDDHKYSPILSHLLYHNYFVKKKRLFFF